MTERREGRQNALIHEGVPPDDAGDINERGDEAADIRQPDGTSEVPHEEQEAQN